MWIKKIDSEPSIKRFMTDLHLPIFIASCLSSLRRAGLLPRLGCAWPAFANITTLAAWSKGQELSRARRASLAGPPLPTSAVHKVVSYFSCCGVPKAGVGYDWCPFIRLPRRGKQDQCRDQLVERLRPALTLPDAALRWLSRACPSW